MSYVTDTSIIFRLLTSQKKDDLLRQRLASGRRAHAPALIDAEVTSVIRAHLITSKPNVKITPERAQEMLTDYHRLSLTRHPMAPLQARALELRHNLTAYDAMFVALSETLNLPLLTDDAKFAAASGHRAQIHHYPSAG